MNARTYGPLLAMLASAVVAGGCLEDKASGFDCGTGDDVVYAGDGFCVYGAALIIEGFLCPEARPFGFDGPGGERICGPGESLTEGGIGGVIDAWQMQFEPDATDTTDTILDTGDTSDTVGDSTTETNDTTDTVDPPPQGLCLADHARGVGQSMPVGQFDTACLIEAVCGDGEVAVSCGTMTNAFCTCDFGDQRCFIQPSATCPEKNVTEGEACFDGYGLDACAGDLVCSQPIITSPATCTVRPDLCTTTTCFDDSDCPTNEDQAYRCYGGDPVTGDRGRCRVQVIGENCIDNTDCAAGFTCAGATVCGPCETCDVEDVGTCEPNTNASTTPFIQPSVPRVGTPQMVYWMGSQSQQTYVACSSTVVEVRDEATLSWAESDAVARPDCESDTVRAVDGVEVARSFTVTALPVAERGYVNVRVRGSYYTDCFGPEISSCGGGPVERFSRTMVILP